MTPTQRTLGLLKKQGYARIAIVEKWNPHIKCRQDLFHLIDILALDHNSGVIGIQSTGQAFSEHEHKILTEKRSEAMDWLKTPGTRLILYGWRKLKTKRGGKSTRWQHRKREFFLGDFNESFMLQFSK